MASKWGIKTSGTCGTGQFDALLNMKGSYQVLTLNFLPYECHAVSVNYFSYYYFGPLCGLNFKMNNGVQ